MDLRCVWDAYGPLHGVLTGHTEVVLHGLQSRADLNGSAVKIQRWDGASGRFIVSIGCKGESIKAKAVNLKTSCYDHFTWMSSGSHFGPLPAEMGVSVAAFLHTSCVVGLGRVCRGICNALLLCSECEPLWEVLLSRDLGSSALTTTRCARSFAVGPSLFRGALALKAIFDAKFEIVPGGVDTQADGTDVVACPCLRTLKNVGIGAQGAVRRCAGDELEEAVRKIPIPVDEVSVTLVPGGKLAKRVALCVTEPPMSLAEDGTQEEQVAKLLAFLGKLHNNLLLAVRNAGLRSVAMPTLCTGGIGIPVKLVAIAAVRSIHQDFCNNPSDPLRVRVACFDRDHVNIMKLAKEQQLQHFYSLEEVDVPDLIRTLLPNPRQHRI